jgi:hypothetical protein
VNTADIAVVLTVAREDSRTFRNLQNFTLCERGVIMMSKPRRIKCDRHVSGEADEKIILN